MEVIGKKCIVRTDSAGVHYGTVTFRNDKEVHLSDTRRIWSWQQRFTLSAIANHGVGMGSRLSEIVPENLLTEAIEIIPVSQDAAVNLDEFIAWKP
jgi:hypothetical protein